METSTETDTFASELEKPYMSHLWNFGEFPTLLPIRLFLVHLKNYGDINLRWREQLLNNGLVTTLCPGFHGCPEEHEAGMGVWYDENLNRTRFAFFIGKAPLQPNLACIGETDTKHVSIEVLLPKKKTVPLVKTWAKVGNDISSGFEIMKAFQGIIATTMNELAKAKFRFDWNQPKFEEKFFS